MNRPEIRMQYRLFENMLLQKHLLIAGATGSGKSALVNGLLHTALQLTPDEVGFILVDPKGVELQEYEHLPHTIKYACNPQDMVSALQLGLDITLRRFNVMKFQHIKEYNGRSVYIIVDELADLMTTNKKQIVPIIQRIGQIGRAAKVHMIVCTQCPLAKIIPTEIKVNFDSIVGLRTASAQHSRNIIGVKGCEDFPDPKVAGYARAYYLRGANKNMIQLPLFDNNYAEYLTQYWEIEKHHMNIGQRISQRLKNKYL